MQIRTSRLEISRLTLADAGFMLGLATDPDWLRYIGNRGIHDLDSARAWIESGPMASYRRHGFGLYRVARGCDSGAIGICGLLQREDLDSPDLGFALLPAYRGRGYAREAASAIIHREALAALRLSRLYAFLTPDNLASRKLLLRLGFALAGNYPQNDSDGKLELYRMEV